MIQKPFDRVAKDDIESLVANEVREGRTLEYNQALPTNSDDEKKEFLADVSSFANASGGDILYGVEEKRDEAGKTTGIPERAIGLAGVNADYEVRRLENMIRDSIKPRIAGVHIRPIEGFSDGPVLLLRIQKSYAAPHMVTFKNQSRFFSRNSGGKYQLDVGEIRSAFALSETLPERIRNFRAERLARVIGEETPVPLEPRPKAVLHILPFSAFDAAQTIDVTAAEARLLELAPLGRCNRLQYRYNLDGFVTYDGSEPLYFAYAQLFRNGAVEAVDSYIADNNGVLDHVEVETHVIQGVTRYLALQRNLGLTPPFPVLLSFVGVRGCRIAPSFRTPHTHTR